MCGAGVVDLCAAAIRVVVAMYGGDRRGAGGGMRDMMSGWRTRWNLSSPRREFLWQRGQAGHRGGGW